MNKEIEVTIEFLHRECIDKINIPRTKIRYSKKFRDGVKHLGENGFTEEQILSIVPVSKYSVRKWTGALKKKEFRKVSITSTDEKQIPSPVSKIINLNKIEELLSQIKTILMVELVLITLLLFYLLSLG